MTDLDKRVGILVALNSRFWRRRSEVGSRLLCNGVALAALFYTAISVSAVEEWSLKQPGWIASIAFSADGKLLANACSDKTARLRNATSGEPIAVFIGHRDYVVSVAFAPDGKTLA